MKVAWLENNLIFQVNNKPDPSINTPTNGPMSRTWFIALSFYNEYKYLKIEFISNNSQLLKDAVFLAINFKKLIIVLVVALKQSRNSVVLTALA